MKKIYFLGWLAALCLFTTISHAQQLDTTTFEGKSKTDNFN